MHCAHIYSRTAVSMEKVSGVRLMLKLEPDIVRRPVHSYSEQRSVFNISKKLYV